MWPTDSSPSQCTCFTAYGHYGFIGKVAYAYYTMDLFSSNVRNFHKPLSVICGPLYAKGDFFAYRLQRNKLFILNIIVYLIFASLVFFLEPLYSLLGVQQENLADIVLISKYYILFYTPLMFIAKFLKGNSRLFDLTFRFNGAAPVPSLVFAGQCVQLFHWHHRWVPVYCQIRLGHPRLYHQFQRQIYFWISHFHLCVNVEW